MYWEKRNVYREVPQIKFKPYKIIYFETEGVAILFLSKFSSRTQPFYKKMLKFSMNQFNFIKKVLNTRKHSTFQWDLILVLSFVNLISLVMRRAILGSLKEYCEYDTKLRHTKIDFIKTPRWRCWSTSVALSQPY